MELACSLSACMGVSSHSPMRVIGLNQFYIGLLISFVFLFQRRFRFTRRCFENDVCLTQSAVVTVLCSSLINHFILSPIQKIQIDLATSR